MKKKKAKRKAAKYEYTIMLLMICVALEELRLELSVYEDDDSIEFSDPITDVQGIISLNHDRTCNIMLIDETAESPSKTTVTMFENAYMKNDLKMKGHSELLIDNSSNRNTLLFFYDNISLPENTTMFTFQSIIMKTVMNVLRFRKVLNHLAEDAE